MSLSRRVLFACYAVAVALVFLWVPWTFNVGYRWLWSVPKAQPLKTYDVVGEARQRLESECQASDLNALGQKWLKAIQEAPPKDRESIRQNTRGAIALWQLHQDELQRRKDMPDDLLLVWLRERANFDAVFPERINLDEPGRQKLLDDWERTVPGVKKWNERIAYSKVDYRRIEMEFVALTSICAAGFILTINKS